MAKEIYGNPRLWYYLRKILAQSKPDDKRGNPLTIPDVAAPIHSANLKKNIALPYYM